MIEKEGCGGCNVLPAPCVIRSKSRMGV